MSNLFNTERKATSSTPFIIGGLIGAVASYFFLTQKGASHRKQLAQKAGELSSGLTGKIAALKRGSTSSSRNQENDDARVLDDTSNSDRSDKAHNMIKHLKQANTN